MSILHLVALLPASPSFVTRTPEAALVIAAVRPSRLAIALGLVAILIAGYAFYASQHTASVPVAPSAVTTDPTISR